jgi:type III pantothenate kinase
LISVSIDIGNTRIKAGIFEDDKLLSVFHFENIEGLKLYCDDLPTSTPIIISSVTNDDLTSFYHRFLNVLILNYKTPLPITNNYGTPHTLGNDRLAGVTGAALLFENKNNLVIDIGTCVKYDFIDSNKIYEGGSISPGLDLKFKALNHFTGKLPLVVKQNLFFEKGNSTQNALLSGVMYGTLMEMKGYINTFSNQYQDLQIILTGGDASYFVDKLKGAIFAEPDLILKGLHEILKYNAPKS